MPNFGYSFADIAQWAAGVPHTAEASCDTAARSTTPLCQEAHREHGNHREDCRTAAADVEVDEDAYAGIEAAASKKQIAGAEAGGPQQDADARDTTAEAGGPQQDADARGTSNAAAIAYCLRPISPNPATTAAATSTGSTAATG